MTPGAGDTNRRVVVGVDGSEPSMAALRWAVDESRGRGRGLHVVSCWSYPMMLSWWGPYQPPISSEELEQAAREVVERAVQEVLGDEPDVDVTIDVLEGAPSLRLLELDAGAEMIVVGSRGRGGFAGLLLGSVSQHLAEHCRCPVVIVHGESRDKETNR